MENEETSRVPRQTLKDRLWRQIRILTAALQGLDKNHVDDPLREVTEGSNHSTERIAEGQDTGPSNEDTLQRKYDTNRVRGGALFRAHLQKEGRFKGHEETNRTKEEIDPLANDWGEYTAIEDDKPRVHAVIEGDIHPETITYERKNDILVMPNPSQTPLMVIKIRGENNGDEAQALGMPDTGSHRNLCSESFAKNHGLEVDEQEKTNLKAANGQHLSCVGATKANISYHGVQLLLTMYVMKDVPNKYVIISKDACQ